MTNPDANSVHGRYELYKRGTSTIIGWLVRTAGRFVDVQAICGRGTIDIDAARRTDNRLKLTTRDLVTLAKIILSEQHADTGTTLSVPTAILDLLQQVIEGRNFCAAFYSEKELGSVSDNASHRHFIHVLEQVQTLLESLPRSQDTINQAPQTDREQTSVKVSTNSFEATFENLFACLEIEEPSDDCLGTGMAIMTNRPSTQAIQNSDITLENKEEDAAFEVYCHLEDLRQQSRLVTETWEEYAAGKVSLLAACMITETACGLMRICDEKFTSTHEGVADWKSVLTPMRLGMICHPGVVYMCSPGLSRAQRTKEQGHELIDLLCPVAAMLLQNVAAKVKNFSDSNPRKPGPGSITHIARIILDQDCYFFDDILQSQVGELALRTRYAKARKRQNLQSEFEAGLVDYFRTDRLPIWLTVAVGTYMKIYEIIGLRPACAGDALIDSFDDLRPKLEEFRDFLAQRGASTEQDSSFINKMFCWESWLKEELRSPPGASMEERDSSGAPTGKKVSVEGQPFASFVSLPSTAGGILYKQLSRFHNNAISTGNIGGMTVAMAHLYTTCKRLGLLRNTMWHDMELVLSSHKDKQLLVSKAKAGAEPSTLLNQYLIALGVPASKFAKGQPLPDCPSETFIRKNGRRVQNTSELMHAMASRAAADQEMGCERGELIEIVLRELVAKAGIPSGKKGKRPASNDSATCSELQLLSTFKKHFMADEPHLNFNYVGFWLRCQEILSIINGMCHSPGRPPFRTVYECLKDAATTSDLSNSLLAKAAKVLDDAIENDGNRFSQEAFSKSSGRIPKALHPHLKTFDCSGKVEALQGLTSKIPVLDEMAISLSAAGTAIYDSNNGEGFFERFEAVMMRAGSLLQKEQYGVSFCEGGPALPEGSDWHGWMKSVDDVYK